MTAFWLSLVMATAGCAGLILAGRGHWQGWAIGLAVQPVWAVFAVITKGYGLLIICVMYGSVYGKNLLKWRREKKIEGCIHYRSRCLSGDENWMGLTRPWWLGGPYRAYCIDCPKTWPTVADWRAHLNSGVSKDA